MVGMAPDPMEVAKIERRARGIHDPIMRLKYLHAATSQPGRSVWRRWRWLAFPVLAVLSLGSHAVVRDPAGRKPRAAAAGTAAVSAAAPAAGDSAEAPNVWRVENTAEYEVYSNGLRIENGLAVANEPRSYRLIPLGGAAGPGAAAGFEPRRDQPAGIVFHTTESCQAPFEPSQNRALKRIGQSLLQYIRGKRAYHFVIDRFGRVHRIVAESDAANHAGHSLWADKDWLYMGLNASFLGVAFEATTQTGPDQAPANQAQIHAAKVLTEMLRSKYHIPAENCVTHAQVSVNPDNMRIGWHTDWGTNFPFRELGLPDNYETPNPGLYLFGFEYDPAYRSSTSPALWKGLELAEDRLRARAAALGFAEAGYRKLLQQRYRDRVAAQQRRNADEENEHEQK